MYEVWINGQLEKTYKHKLQAIIYLMLNGHVYSGKGLYFLSNKVKIKYDRY